MIVAACYDIADDRRRRRVAGVLEGWGVRVQESVFEVVTTGAGLQRLARELERLVEPREDSVRFYPLCSRCRQKILHHGGPPVAAEPPCYIVF